MPYVLLERGSLRLATAACLVFLSATSPSTVIANGAVFRGEGYDIFPVKTDDIAMRKEVVEMVESTKTGHIEVRCSFWFVNCADTATVQMGFPLQDDEGIELGFQVSVDGEPVEYDVGYHKTRWSKWDERPWTLPVYLWPVRFARDQERRVDVSYQIDWSEADMQTHGTFVTYVLTTGALWREPIGVADLSFRFSTPVPLPALGIAPLGFDFDGQTIRWHRENFSPEGNLSVAYNRDLMAKFRDRFHTPAKVAENGYVWDHRLVVLEYWSESEDPDPLEGVDYESAIPDSARAELLIRYAAHAAGIRNEIYARHGYRFRTIELASTFRNQPWYSPRDDFDENDLNEIEQMNVMVCRAFEDAIKRATTPKDLNVRIGDFHAKYW